MCALPEGSLFRQEDIAANPDEACDFADLRGYDYDHVFDGYCTRIVETNYLRRLPKVQDVLTSYCALRGCNLVETGDRTAWKRGIKRWEPIMGYRYYTDGAAEILSLGNMKIRIIAGPDWIRADSEAAVLFRCLYDQSPKDMTQSLRVVFERQERSREFDPAGVIAFARAIDPETVPTGWPDPADVAARITSLIDARRETGG